MMTSCDRNIFKFSSLGLWSVRLIFLYSMLFLANVRCSSVYLSHQIHRKSNIHKDDINLPNILPSVTEEVHTSQESYEYHQNDYSIEQSSTESLEMSSPEHKVQRQLLKDMGLQRLPEANQVRFTL